MYSFISEKKKVCNISTKSFDDNIHSNIIILRLVRTDMNYLL